MESLLKQARVRFSDATQRGTEEAASKRGRTIPPQRTQSFKGEKSKTQNWFQRQFSGSMSKDYDTSDGGDYSAAVAAAAYAINSLYAEMTPEEKLPEFEEPDESTTRIKSETEDASVRMREPLRRSKSASGTKHKYPDASEEPDASTTRIKSETEDASVRTREPSRRSKSASAPTFFQPLVPETSSAKLEGKKEDTSTKMQKPVRRSKSLSDDSSASESSDEKITSVRKFFGNSSDQAPPIKKKISFAGNVTDPAIGKETEKAITTKPSLKKRLSFGDDKSWLKRPSIFADNTLDSIGARRPESAGPKPGSGFPKPVPRASIETALPPPPQPPTPLPRTRVQGSKADVWEKAEMAKINRRYEKMRSTIESWENKKREKAKRHKEKIERELEEKRARALQKFRSEMETIDAVAKGAIAEAEKKKRKKELKVKKKADRIRKTGKFPPKCFCF